MHAFDPITGKFIQEWWTPEELEAQFDFSRDDHGVIMSNEEFLGVEWGVPMMIEDHPDAKRICNRNDNQNVVDALNNGKTANVKNLDALLFIKAISFATGVGVEAEKCRSEDNKRSDPGSRKEDQSDWITEKSILESRAGKESTKQQVDPTLRSLATWIAAPTEENATDRLECVWKRPITWCHGVFSRGNSHIFRVSMHAFCACITGALEGKPIQLLDWSPGDYQEVEPDSPARLKLSPLTI